MTPSRSLLRTAALCAFLSALTTLAVHLLPGLWADARTFEAQLDLRNNAVYMGRLWLVLVHCLLVVISMYGARALAPNGHAALPDLGLLAFVVFACTEILRTSLVLFTVNRGWRAAYVAAADAATRERARSLIEGFSGINGALFFIFYTAFLLGTLCYGFTFWRASGWTRGIGWLFLVWGALGLPMLIDTIAGTEVLSPYFGWVGRYFIAPARALVGVWLWRAGASVTAPERR